jgi:hypothetical protein
MEHWQLLKDSSGKETTKKGGVERTRSPSDLDL